jgi:penicillin-binding protein 2
VTYYKRLGYQGSEQVGVAGLEKSQEKYLAGTHGASLTLYNPQGQAISRLAQVETQPAQNITTTLDTQLQVNLEKSFQDFPGAVVVMERDTGRILAMVSSPGYDQNRFMAANPNNQNGVLLQNLLNNEDRPLLNRAAQASYPLGSVFKIITMAAALETGVFTNDSMYDCQSDYRGIPGLVLDDWTKAKGYPPSGELNLSGGLIRSCNPWFYHIVLTCSIADSTKPFPIWPARSVWVVLPVLSRSRKIPETSPTRKMKTTLPSLPLVREQRWSLRCR